MLDFIMKPKVDFAFKEIMMDEKARTGFLAAVLHINPEDIKETQILNTNLRKLHEDDKLGILDVRVLLNNDMEIDAEIQLSELEVWPDRSLFYTSKMFKEEKDFYSCFHIREDTRNFIYTDKMEFHVIELPKLPEEIRENSSDLELWAKFINAEGKEELDMIAKKNVYIKSAYDRLQVISQDKQKRLEYEARQKALFDYNQFMYEAERRGEKKGRQEGKEEGRQEEKLAVAKNLIALGLPTDVIVQGTGLSAGIIDTMR